MGFVKFCAVLDAVNICTLFRKNLFLLQTLGKFDMSLSASRGVIEEDEVCSVARLLGDLVSYRASGTGHLEFLAG